MFFLNYTASDLTNPFIGRHVPPYEYYVVQVPKGPSMLEEKLACPMTDAAHERRFVTAQLRISAPAFFDEHVSIVARTVNDIEKRFYKSASGPQDETYITGPVDTNGYVPYMEDLMYPGDWATGEARSNPDQLLESDLRDPVNEDNVDEDNVDEDSVDVPSAADFQLLLEQARKKRQSQYWQTGQPRVNRQIVYKIDPNLRSKPSDSVRNLPQSSLGL